MGQEKNICFQFQRTEMKYLPSDMQAQRMLDALAPYVRPDPFGETRIYNLYLDTPDQVLVGRSMEQPVYKEKMRLRRYGAGDMRFLEIKKKYRGVVYKRRIALTGEQADALLQRGELPPDSGQTYKELRAFLARYALLPTAHLSYNRTAYYAKDDPSLRITFDTDICARFAAPSLADGAGDFPVLPPGTVLMEIKAGGAVPLWLVRILSAERLYKVSFSKYGCAYAAYTKTEAFK